MTAWTTNRLKCHWTADSLSQHWMSQLYECTLSVVSTAVHLDGEEVTSCRMHWCAFKRRTPSYQKRLLCVVLESVDKKFSFRTFHLEDLLKLTAVMSSTSQIFDNTCCEFERCITFTVRSLDFSFLNPRQTFVEVYSCLTSIMLCQRVIRCVTALHLTQT